MKNELIHYGIKGMKWGIRRYQNPDGTLTAAGKKRAAKQARKQDYKNRRNLSDKELNDKLDRLQKEKRFKELSREDIQPGRTAVKNFLKSSGGKVLYTAAIGGLAYAGKAAMTGKVDLDQAATYLFPNPNAKRK